MPLRQIGRALASIFRDLSGIGASLLTIQQQGSTIIMQLDDLKKADAAEAGAVLTALAAIKSLSQQHQADLSQLAAQANAGQDVGPLVASMQARAQSLTDAVAALHTNVASASDSVSGAGSDTISGATVDSVSGAGTATVDGSASVSGAGSVAGADTVAGSAGNATL